MSKIGSFKRERALKFGAVIADAPILRTEVWCERVTRTLTDRGVAGATAKLDRLTRTAVRPHPRLCPVIGSSTQTPHAAYCTTSHGRPWNKVTK